MGKKLFLFPKTNMKDSASACTDQALAGTTQGLQKPLLAPFRETAGPSCGTQIHCKEDLNEQQQPAWFFRLSSQGVCSTSKSHTEPQFPCATSTCRGGSEAVTDSRRHSLLPVGASQEAGGTGKPSSFPAEDSRLYLKRHD